MAKWSKYNLIYKYPLRKAQDHKMFVQTSDLYVITVLMWFWRRGELFWSMQSTKSPTLPLISINQFYKASVKSKSVQTLISAVHFCTIANSFSMQSVFGLYQLRALIIFHPSSAVNKLAQTVIIVIINITELIITWYLQISLLLI